MVIGVMMSRSWTVNVFQAFTPTWYEKMGYGPEFYGPLATTLVLASAVGTVGHGLISVRHNCGSHPLAALESSFVTGIDNRSALQRDEAIGETACKLVVLFRQQQREAESA